MSRDLLELLMIIDTAMITNSFLLMIQKNHRNKAAIRIFRKNFNIEFQDIPGWQIKSTIVNSYGTYEDREKYG